MTPYNLEQRYPIGFFPTPLHPLERLSAMFPGYRIFIKRDDLTGLASGGNKTRKLEYFIARAKEANCDTVLTAGAQQSNHCRQTAAACAMAGLECHLLLGGAEPGKYEGNLLLSDLLGAKIHFAGEKRKGEDLEALASQLNGEGKKCFIIPYGGSDGTGAFGFANALRELKGQLAERSLTLDYLFFASSSGGTQAGLLLGKDLFGLSCELMPVNIDKEVPGTPTLEEKVADIANSGAGLLGYDKTYDARDVHVIRGYDEAGYAVVTENEKHAIRLLASTEGIILDPVYTGRAFFGMIDHLEKKLLRPGSTVLFWHTGGFPANFYYL